SGVRWGEDERARAQTGGYREFSFAFGLDRMLAGFACGDDEQALVAGVAPLAGVEGSGAARVEALLAVLAAWRKLRELSSREMGAAEWQHRLNALFDGLYASDSNDIAESRALERVRGALAELAGHAEAASLQALPWHDLRAFLRERLEQSDPQQRLFAGGITFCGMVPLRVVPFRVICLLGMGEAAFPRRDPGGMDPLTADRRAGRAHRGDRSVREDDRLLFLQLIASARDAFYASWIGRDAHSNETLAPSVVVAELMDVLREGYLAADAVDALLPHVEPLHPFDASLFDAHAPRSYGKEWLAAAGAPEAESANTPFVPESSLPQLEFAQASTLALDELRRFLLDPERGFLEQGLGMMLPREERDDADDEPLSPTDALTRWRRTRALLDFCEGNASGDRDLLRARGQLRPGTIAGRHVLRAWLDALLCTAAGVDKPVRLVRLDGNDACSFALPRLAQAEARGQLHALIELHREGRRAPLPFFVRTSWLHARDHAKAEKKAGAAITIVDAGHFETAAKNAESDNGFGGHNEFESDAVCIAWRGRDLPGAADGEHAQALQRTALAVF